MAVKAPWLRPSGPILALAAYTGLENAALTLYLAGKAAWALSVFDNLVLTIACSLMSGHGNVTSLLAKAGSRLVSYPDQC